MEGNLWDALNLLTKPEDMEESKFFNRFVTYLDYEIRLKVNELGTKRLENLLKNLPKATTRIADSSLAKLVPMVPKDRHYLSPLANPVFFAKIGSSSAEVTENSKGITSLFPTLQIPCSYSYNPVSEDVHEQNEDISGGSSNNADLAASLEIQVLEDEVPWDTQFP